MKKSKELELNYQAYTVLILKRKLPLFLLGLFVIVVASSFIFKIFIIRKPSSLKRQKNTNHKNAVKKYTVEEGEDLWQIAEKNYGSGFNAYDIARANNLKEPYILQKGQILIIPNVTKRAPTQGELTPSSASTEQVTLTDITYVVQEGEQMK